MDSKSLNVMETTQGSQVVKLSNLDVDGIVQEILTSLKRVVPYDSVGVFFLEEDVLRFVTCQGFSDPKSVQGLSFPADDPLFLEIKSTGKAVIIKDAQKDPRFKNWGNTTHVRGWMGIPLITNGMVLGYITLDSKIADIYDETIANTATAFASQAAMAIENARIFQAEQERLREAEILRESLAIVASTLEQDVAIDRILEQLERVVPYNSASVQLIKNGYLEIVGGRGLSEGNDHNGMKFLIDAKDPAYPILMGQKPYVHYDDVRKLTPTFLEPPHERVISWLAVPLKVKGAINGIIALDGYRTAQFTERHAQLAVVYGNQVAIALENARLYSDMQHELNERKRAEEKVHELNISLEKRVEERTLQLQAEKNKIERFAQDVQCLRVLTNFLQACLTIEETAGIISDHMSNMFPKTGGSIFLASESSTDLALLTGWGTNSTEDVLDPITCWGIRRSRPHVRQDRDSAPRCSHYNNDLPKTGSMCLPLLVQGDVIGLICLEREQDENNIAFPSEMQNLANASADSIALALANLRLREKLHNQAVRDPLTGLFNKRFMSETLDREVHRAMRARHPLSIIFLEIDDFRVYNNTYGHEAGDYVIRKLSDAIRSILRRSDFPCRYGGDEFVIILPDMSLQDAGNKAEELRQAVQAMALSYNNQMLGTVTVSSGVASFPQHGDTGETVLKMADAASYRAKAAGKNCVVVE